MHSGQVNILHVENVVENVMENVTWSKHITIILQLLIVVHNIFHNKARQPGQLSDRVVLLCCGKCLQKVRKMTGTCIQ
jgi:hypothetical protein